MTRIDHDATVAVDLGPRSYAIRITAGRSDYFGPFARESLDASWAGRSCRRAAIITDEHVAPLVPPFAASLRASGIANTTIVLPAGETTKSLDRATSLFDRLIELRADRHFAIVAIGGGVIGDLAGFVAATFTRGLPLLMVPTSLLAQVDSSVGGKVGVNHPRAKNIIGAFHQPVGVWIDSETLDTLPIREYRCGMAEVVKYGVILDQDFFKELEANPALIEARDPGFVRKMVATSCELKASVVTRDEREETGLRAVLNFGHTIAHAIEAVAGYDGPFSHGEAVAIGMVAEAGIAQKIGWIGPEIGDRIESLLKTIGLPVSAPGLDLDALIEAMTRDKKNRDGRVRFVLPREIGRVELTDEPDETSIRAVLRSIT